MRFWFTLVLCSFLGGCGFQLRGEVPLAPPLHKMYLQTAAPYGPLTRSLKQSLKYSDVHFTEVPADADVILQIISEDKSQQLLSVSGTQQTRQYNLVLSVVFQLTDVKGRVLLPPETLTETQTIPVQSNQVLSSSNEAKNLYNLMRQTIVYDLMNRLASKQVTTMLMKKP